MSANPRITCEQAHRRAFSVAIAAEMNQSRAAFEHRLQALSTQIERLRRPARQTAFQDHAEASPDLHSPAPTGDAKAPTTLPSEQDEVIAAVTDAMQKLAWHRQNAADHAQPALDLGDAE